MIFFCIAGIAGVLAVLLMIRGGLLMLIAEYVPVFKLTVVISLLTIIYLLLTRLR